MRAVIVGITMIVAVFAAGLYVASPQPTEGAIDCSTVSKGPKFCNIKNPDIPARQPGDPVTFLISGCGYHNGDRSMPCYHSVAGIIAVLIAAANFILGIVGALALLMFVWGGLQWAMSAGEEERVKAGTTTLRNAVIGLLIVFGSWLGVNYIVNTLTDNKGLFKSGANTWFTVNYDTLCYRPLTAEELKCQLTRPYQPVAPAPSAPVLPRTTCCYQTAGGTKTGERADLETCKKTVEGKLSRNEIKSSPVFHCTYKGGMDIETNKICWEVDTARGSKPLYCDDKVDLSTSAGTATTTNSTRMGICCVSDEDSTRNPRYVSYPVNETQGSCQSKQSDWRVSGGTKGIFILKFCPSANDGGVCGPDSGTGYRNINCPSGLVDFKVN